jgi:ADP-ribose pyrophosphatase
MNMPTQSAESEEETWHRIEPTVVSTIGTRTVVSKTFVVPGGATHHYETTWPEDCVCVAIIALTTDDKVIVARQFRPGPERFMNEIPGGIVGMNETLEAAARRELLCEVGYKPGTLEYLGEAGPDSHANAVWHYYFATGCTPTPGSQQPEACERVDVRLVTIEALIADARSHQMTDPAAVLLAYERLTKLRG